MRSLRTTNRRRQQRIIADMPRAFRHHPTVLLFVKETTFGMTPTNGEIQVTHGEVWDDVCGRDGCEGVLVISPPDDGGCSCHLHPPCSYCMNTVAECPTCGWRGEPPD